MKILKIDLAQPEVTQLEKARQALRDGKVVVYPTDTIYGLGAHAFKKDVVEKVFEIKRRSKDKPLSICLSKVQDLKRVAHLDIKSFRLANQLLPGPYTLILNRGPRISDLLSAGTDKIGVRIPDNMICRLLSMEFPITTTSANISGEKTPSSVEEIQKNLGEKVDIYLDAGDCSNTLPSSVVDMTVWPPKILREGQGLEEVRLLLDEI